MSDYKQLMAIDKMSYADTEFIRIPKTWIEAITEADSKVEQERIFYKVINDRKLDIAYAIESMDDDLLQFKAYGLRYQNALEKIYAEQCEKIEKVWDNFNVQDKLYDKIKELEGKLRPTVSTIKEISQNLERIDTYRLKETIDLLNTFSNMNDENKDILRMLLSREE